MSDNYHTPYVDDTTVYSAASMNAPLAEIDQKITDMDHKVWFIAGNYLNSKPPNSALLLRVIIGQYMVLESGAPGSHAGCATQATAEVVLTIKRNGVSAGTITIAAGETTGSFTVAADKRFYAGDVLSVEAPASQDATMQDISVTLKLTRPPSYTSTTSTSTSTTHTTTSTTTTTVTTTSTTTTTTTT